MSTYLLIHGSWHGAWCWYKIAPRIEAAGHEAIVPDMPGHGRDWTAPGEVAVDHNVDAILQVLDRAPEPINVVVHSRNGMVVAQAAEARPEKIRSITFLASLLPPIGDAAPLAQSMEAGQWAYDPDSDFATDQCVDYDPEAGFDMLQRRVFRKTLYADCSDDDVALSHALLTPEPRGPRSATDMPIRTTHERFGRVPRFYIELTQDRAVSIQWQRRMHRATPCQRVFSIDASHSAYFSQPDQLTRCILLAGGDRSE